MPKYRLNYYDAKGRAEVIRMVFAYSNTEFDDNRLKEEEFATAKACAPTGAFPYLEVEGQQPLAQSGAIAMYLGREFGLAGSSSMEQARVEMFLACFYDIATAFYDAFFSEHAEKKPEMMKKVKEQTVPNMLDRLDALCVGPYLTGEKISVADFAVYTFFDQMSAGIEDPSKYPKLKAIVDGVSEAPSIADYLKRRPKTEH